MARFLLVLAVLAIAAVSVRASDPELTTDFFLPPNVNITTIDGNYFTFTGFRGGVSPAPAPGKFGVTKAFSNVFTAVTGLGVAYAMLEYTATAMNPPHTHPRGTELLYVMSGTLNVGVVDSTNKLYEQILQTGDVFVFPKGLVHYQINLDTTTNATALSAFSSSSPGLIVIPANLFASGIPEPILAQAFQVGTDVIQQLEAPFQH